MPHSLLRALSLGLLLSTSTLAARVTVPGTAISFEAPPGWTKMSKEDIAIKYARGVPPQNVLASKDQTGTIAYELRAAKLPANQLKDILPAFVATFEQQLGSVKWQKKEIVQRGGLTWVELQFETPALDQPIYNHMLFTSVNGQMLAINATSTVKNLPKYRGAIDAAMKSVRAR